MSGAGGLLSYGRTDALLMFLIRHCAAHYVDVRDLAPGHPVYDAIAAQVLFDAGLPAVRTTDQSAAPDRC